MIAAYQEAYEHAFEDAYAMYPDDETRTHYIAVYEEVFDALNTNTYNEAFDEAYHRITEELAHEEEPHEEPGFFSNLMDWVVGPDRGELLQ